MNPDAKTRIYLVAIASLAVCFSLSIPQEALAQLPPTNMGKFVHKPGDNQYGNKAQKLRHPPQPVRPVSRPMMGGGGGGRGGSSSYRSYRRTRPKPQPDISLQAIPADEPIAPQGFPPLPEAVDIPGVQRTNGLTAINNSSSSSSYGGGGAPRANPYQGNKQGYGHYSPGAFMPQKQSSVPTGGGDMHQHYKHVPTQSTGSGVGYYKARSAPLPTRGDTFGAQDGSGRTGKGARSAPTTAGAGAGAGGGPSLGQALKGMGREPKLDDRVYGNTASAPEAPTPVQINQASTQDLSLPDDDFKQRKPQSAGGRFLKRSLKRVGNRMGSMMNSMPITNTLGR